jgi:signal transduction histidine kinase/CheY-like chemotaxis protein
VNVEERVLIHAPVGRDGQLAQRVLAEAGVEAVLPAGMEELCAMLDEGAGAVLLTEETLTASGMALLLGALSRQPTWSDVPLLVFGAPSSTLLEQSANMTVIERPVRIRTLVSATRAALRARRRQYETRNLVLKLEQSVRDRDQFLAMLGHELRNPLAAIVTASELMERRAGDAFRREREIVARQSRHLARLVDDLLEVARVTSGKIALHPSTFDLHGLVQRALAVLQPAARQRSVEIVLHPGAAPLFLTADTVRVEQVLTNIVGNAIKYTPSGGRIDVEVRQEGGEAVLRVRDTGVGIDPAILPRIFDLFIQAPDTMDRAQGGMGIGLTLVQRLVTLHGGSVRARSEGSGKGSEFEVRLPLRAAAPPAAKSAPAGPVARRTVLLVEDNADSREAMQIALEHMGHRVISSADGAAAIHLALAEKPDVMIVDLGLPGKNGYEVARAMREALGKGVRLLALTGYGQPEDRERALAAGFDVFLTKPAEIDAIGRAMDGSNARERPSLQI